MKTPLLAAAALGALTLPAFAQEPAPGRAPSYNWVGVSYGSRYFENDFASGRAPDAYRIASNFRVVPHVYLVAAYTSAQYPYQRDNTASIGVGAYAPLSEALHGVLQVTYEENESKDTGVDFVEEGFGIEAGARWVVGASQFDLTLKYAELEGEDYGFEDSYTGVNLAAILPLTEAVGIVVNLEHASLSGDLFEGVKLETYLMGLRFGFGRRS